MIKDAEIAMVNAATYALEAQDRNPGATTADVIKHFLQDSAHGMKGEVKIYAVAAINEVLKLKSNKLNRGKNNKQLIQAFVNNIQEFSRRIKEETY